MQLASEGIKRDYTQGLFDTANYTFEEKDGDVLVRQVKESLGNYFLSKRIAAWVSLFIYLFSTRWLPGFARVPHYAPSPCHMP